MRTVKWKKLSTKGGVLAETATFARGFIRITVRQSFTVKPEPEKFRVQINGKWHPLEFGSMDEAKEVGIAVARTTCRIALEEIPRGEEVAGDEM